MPIASTLKPILHPRSTGMAPVRTGMARSYDGMSQEYCVVSTTAGCRISQCYRQLSELSGMHFLTHPVLVAHDLVLHPGKAHDGELLRLDPHKKTCEVFLSGFQDVYVEPTGEIGLLRGGVWVYFDVFGQPVAAPASSLPPPATPAAAPTAAPLAATPPVAAPLCPPSGPAIVVPRTDPVVPAHLASQCDSSGAPEFPTFVSIPGGTLDQHIDPNNQNWTIPNVPGDGYPSYASFCGFYFTQTTVTNAMWRRFLREVGKTDTRQLSAGFNGPRQPAVMVSYQEATEYAQWLQDYLEGEGSRVILVEVPDRLCWEYVARAGRTLLAAAFATATGLFLTPAGSPPIVHWKSSQPVDADDHAFPPIVFGSAELYHMGGNVWEWTNDTAVRGLRMMCGGSYLSTLPHRLQLDFAEFSTGRPSADIGFRLFAM